MDILIVGGGVAGLATAYHLARGGLSVEVVERESTLGAAASGQNAAILRSFSGDACIDRIARRSAEFLREPPSGFSPVPLLDPVGLLLGASGEQARRWRSRLPFEGAQVVEPGRGSRLAPHVDFTAADPELLLWFERDGRIDVAALIEALAAGARQAGARIRTGTAVQELMLAGDRLRGVRLRDGDEILAERVVLAAGAWTGSLGATAGSRVELRPTRRHLLVTEADTGIDARLPVVWLENQGFYCRPESGGMLLCGCDLTDVDPDACIDDSNVKMLIAEKAGRLLGDLDDAGAAHFWHGLRTLTDDDRFAIGADPDVEGLFWVAGLGGHGMTCGVEVGRLAALAIAGGADEEEAVLLRALDPARLQRSERKPAASASREANPAVLQ